jgi:hypothetical protein
MLVNYCLAKTLLFFAFRLRRALQTRENLLGVKNFAEFCDTSGADYVLSKIDTDRWVPNYNIFFYSLEY